MSLWFILLVDALYLALHTCYPPHMGHFDGGQLPDLLEALEEVGMIKFLKIKRAKPERALQRLTLTLYFQMWTRGHLFS